MFNTEKFIEELKSIVISEDGYFFRKYSDNEGVIFYILLYKTLNKDTFLL